MGLPATESGYPTEGSVFSSPKHRAWGSFWLVALASRNRDVSEKCFRTSLMGRESVTKTIWILNISDLEIRPFKNLPDLTLLFGKNDAKCPRLRGQSET